jgi:hypothetical protein
MNNRFFVLTSAVIPVSKALDRNVKRQQAVEKLPMN